MKQSERAAQREVDHQRWADDGGFIPEPEPETTTRSPWPTVAVAIALGFVFGWLTARRSR
jgi:hypothetical protein